jgi:hypothetical protein
MKILEIEGGNNGSNVWKTSSGRGYGPLVRQTQTTESMNDEIIS